MGIYEEQAACAFKPIHDNPIVLDFTGCRYLGVVHQILKEKFGFPDYYGENWSALWDLSLIHILGTRRGSSSKRRRKPFCTRGFPAL